MFSYKWEEKEKERGVDPGLGGNQTKVLQSVLSNHYTMKENCSVTIQNYMIPLSERDFYKSKSVDISFVLVNALLWLMLVVENETSCK